MSPIPCYEVGIKIMIEKEPLVTVKTFRGFENSNIITSFKIYQQQFRELKGTIKILNKDNFEDETMGLVGSDWI